MTPLNRSKHYTSRPRNDIYDTIDHKVERVNNILNDILNNNFVHKRVREIKEWKN